MAEIAKTEPLKTLPPLAYPAQITVTGKASRSALVAFEANHYSVPPAHTDRTVTVQARVGEPTLRILSAAGEIVATHRRAPAGAAQKLRTREHRELLEKAVLAAFTTDHACRRKAIRPPGDQALTELARLTGLAGEPAPVISLADYQQLADVAEAVSSAGREGALRLSRMRDVDRALHRAGCMGHVAPERSGRGSSAASVSMRVRLPGTRLAATDRRLGAGRGTAESPSFRGRTGRASLGRASRFRGARAYDRCVRTGGDAGPGRPSRLYGMIR